MRGPTSSLCLREAGASSRRLVPWVILALAGVLALVAGCTPEDPQSTFGVAGPVARMQLDLFKVIFWAAVFVFVVVEGVLVYTVFRFRRKRAQGEPPQTHGNAPLEIAWTLAPAVVLAVIAVPTVRTILELGTPPSREPLRVEVRAHQWWWEFSYSDLGIVTANELHIPVGQPVALTLRSGDVIHSLWVPKLAGKLDAIPTRNNTLWFTAEEPGTYLGQCAEFCGIAHALMRLRVIAQPEEEFQQWVRGMRTPALAATGEAARGADLFVSKACIACHTIAGSLAAGTFGPNLTHFGTRGTLAAGLLENTRANLELWLRDPEMVKPGNRMAVQAPVYQKGSPLALREEEVSALAAYLLSLQPDLSQPPILGTPTPAVAGPTPGAAPDPGAGKRVFEAQGCTACHATGVGPDLMGLEERAASRVPGLSGEEYVRQSVIEPSAFLVPGYADLMPRHFGTVLSPREIDDLVAYLLTLGWE